jgi:hypothetical protein
MFEQSTTNTVYLNDNNIDFTNNKHLYVWVAHLNAQAQRIHNLFLKA